MKNAGGLPVLVCGEGLVAARAYAMLAERGYPVRTVTRYETHMPAVGLIDCGVGLQPSFENVMRALGQGVPVATTNALLMAVHGRVLSNAARGQQAALMFGGALGVMQPMTGWLPMVGVQRLTLVVPEGANAILQRMMQRDEEAHKAQLALEAQGLNMANAAGKQTFVQGLALHGLIDGAWVGPEAGVRSGLEVMSKGLVAQMRRFGLTPLYTVQVDAMGVRAGVVACVPTSPLMDGMTRERAVVETTAGAQMMSRAVVAEEAMAQAVVTDMVEALQPARRMVGLGGFAAPLVGQYMVVGEYVQRHRVLEAGCVVLDEQMTGTGEWLAIVEAPAMPTIASLMVMPVAGGFSAESVGLRLVG